jgi:hypothetical protein
VSPQFVYMAKGKETMVNENTREEVTAGDGLQLGRTSVDQTDMQTAEEEVRQLQERVEKVSYLLLYHSTHRL